MARRVNQEKLNRISERLREVDWHDLSLIGTELGEIDTIRRQPFQFSDFLDALEDGFLANLSHPVYVFLQTEPVYFPEGIILTVPVLIAYSSAVPPPNLVARDSVQSEDANVRALNPFGGRPEDMAPLKMAWRPYVPPRIETDALPYISGGLVKPPVVSLEWEVRQQKAAHFNEMEANAVKFINPYVILPRVFRALEKPEVTSVTFDYTYNEKTYEVIYDKETDDTLAEFIPAYLSDNELPETPCAEEIKELIKAKFASQRKIRDEQWDETQALLAQYTDEQIKLLEEAKVYKFYPRHPKYDLTAFVSKRVNRYFKDADEVFGGKKIEKDEMTESDIEEFERFEKAEEKRLKDLEIAQEKERRRLERLKMAEIEKSKTKEERAAERKAKREAEKKRKAEEKAAKKEAEKKRKEEEKAKEGDDEGEAKEEETAAKKKKKVTKKKAATTTKKAATTTKKATGARKTTKPAAKKAATPKKSEKKKAAAAAADAEKPATPKKGEKKAAAASSEKTTPKKKVTTTPKKEDAAGGDSKKRKRETPEKKSAEPSAKKSKK